MNIHTRDTVGPGRGAIRSKTPRPTGPPPLPREMANALLWDVLLSFGKGTVVVDFDGAVFVVHGNPWNGGRCLMMPVDKWGQRTGRIWTARPFGVVNPDGQVVGTLEQLIPHRKGK